MDLLLLERRDSSSEQFAAIIALIAENGRAGTEVTSVPESLSLTGRQVEAGLFPFRFDKQKWWWGPA